MICQLPVDFLPSSNVSWSSGMREAAHSSLQERFYSEHSFESTLPSIQPVMLQFYSCHYQPLTKGTSYLDPLQGWLVAAFISFVEILLVLSLLKSYPETMSWNESWTCTT